MIRQSFSGKCYDHQLRVRTRRRGKYFHSRLVWTAQLASNRAREVRGMAEEKSSTLRKSWCAPSAKLATFWPSCIVAWARGNVARGSRTSRTYLCMHARMHTAPGFLLSLSFSLSLCLYSFLCFAISLYPLLSGPRVVVTRNSNLSFRRRWKSCGTWRRELTR